MPDSTDKIINLLRRLGERHRPVSELYPDAYPGTYAWHCPSGCNGGVRRVWVAGDPGPGPGCQLWREYHAFWTGEEVSDASSPQG